MIKNFLINPLLYLNFWPVRRGVFVSILLLAGSLLFGVPDSSNAQVTLNCSANFQIDQTLGNGARWQMCWEHREWDGIVLRDLYYTPPGGVGRRSLTQGSISQVHVPYDDNSGRFHDITDDGFGDNNLNDLTPAECPNGALIKFGTKDAICRQLQPRGHAFKGLGIQEQGDLLSLFSVSTSGEYNYIPVWRFFDDGTIELLMGAAGKLQRFTTDSRYGWPVRADGTRGTSHTHNYYWRLDFDLGESGTDDIVEEFNYLSSADNARRSLGVSRLITEVGRSIDPLALRSWRIRDGSITNAQGRPISYHLEPVDVTHRDVGPSYEPWTANEFYVTKARTCERYVSHNPQLNGCAADLTGFVNGESLEGADVVLWYGATFHHIPRDEDEPLMYTHWTGFRLRPRDWLDVNPAAADVVTCNIGDVTCDGASNAADVLFMLQHDVQLRTNSDQLPLPAGTLYGYSCDVSGEGACNAVDALLTLQCSVGLSNKVCPGQATMRSAADTIPTSVPALLTLGELTAQDNVTEVRLRLNTATSVAALSLVLAYDPTWPGTVTCASEPGFDLDACQVDAAAGVVRFSMVATEGRTGEMEVGTVHFAPSGTSASPFLILQSAVVADVDGTHLPISSENALFSQRFYLPLVAR